MRYDVAVIGAGCIGASTAKHLAEAGHRVVVYEKEARPALHQSGRNSGVIHAGYNLTPGSQKARFCVEGSRRMREFCRQRGVAVVEGGILVVAQEEAQEAVLRDLEDRGRRNGTQVHLLDEAGLRDIEPHARGSMALHAPEGASVDARGFVQALAADAEAAGATFRFGTRIRSPDDVPARIVVNAAGLQADRLAASLAPDLRVIPFRGFYAHIAAPATDLVRSHIYSAPDPRFPFLGVHLSRRFDGTVSAGPGAMLAFGLEAYQLLSLRGGGLGRTLAWPGFWRILRDRSFRRHIRSEVRKSLSTRAIWTEARRLVPGLPRRAVRRASALAGNRAQLVDRAGNLVDDIVVRETERSVHVLNAVSPGLTCSLPFGQHLAERAIAKL